MAERSGARVTEKPDIQRSWTPHEVFAEQLVLLRERHGWSQTRLAEAMTGIGMAMSQSKIADIERGKRQVTIDELVTFAVALGVSPQALMLPTDSRKRMTFANRDLLPIPTVATWWRGDAPLRGGLPPGQGETIDVRTFFDTLPDWRGRLHDRFRDLGELLDIVGEIVALNTTASDDTTDALLGAGVRKLRDRLRAIGEAVSTPRPT